MFILLLWGYHCDRSEEMTRKTTFSIMSKMRITDVPLHDSDLRPHSNSSAVSTSMESMASVDHSEAPSKSKMRNSRYTKEHFSRPGTKSASNSKPKVNSLFVAGAHPDANNSKKLTHGQVEHKASFCEAFWHAWKHIHIFFGIFFLKDPELSRPSRILILYVRLLLLCSFAGLWFQGGKEEKPIGVIIAIAVATSFFVVPITAILKTLMKTRVQAETTQKLLRYHKNSPQTRHIKDKLQKQRILKMSGFILCMLVAVLSLTGIMMFTLAFEVERDGKSKEWMGAFGFSVLQDFMINQSATITLQYTMFRKIATTKAARKAIPNYLIKFTSKNMFLIFK